jgi:hypothetical protein
MQFVLSSTIFRGVSHAVCIEHYDIQGRDTMKFVLRIMIFRDVKPCSLY